MMADVAVTRTDFQYQSSEAADSVYEPVIQHVWSQKPSDDKSETTVTMSQGDKVENLQQHYGGYTGYDRASLIAGTQPCGTSIASASEVNKIGYVHIAPKMDVRRLSYTGSLPDSSGSPPASSPEANTSIVGSNFTESPSSKNKSDGPKEVYVPSGKNIINDSPWPPDFEPTVKEMRRKLYEFGGRREGIDEPPREEMRKLRQYYAVKFRSWLKDGNRDMSQLLCHYYAVAKMSNRCWERAVAIMEKYRLGLLKDMTKGLPVKQSIFQFVDRGNEEYTYDIMCKVERGDTSLQEAKQKYRMILDKRKAKINTAKRLSTIEAMSQVDHDVDSPRRMTMDYEQQRANHVVNGLSPAYPAARDERGKSEDYRDCGPRPMDPMEQQHRYPISPNQTVIKQEMVETPGGVVAVRPGSGGGTAPPGEPKIVMDHEIRALNGIISAKEYEVNHFKDYNVHLQKVGSEREYEIDKLKKKLRDVENERDGMEKKWLDQVQNHVKEKYKIADLQKEVLLWKGKFKNLLDRIQGLECDARRDFDYSCRRNVGDAQANDFVKGHESQRGMPRVGHEGDEKPSRDGGMARLENAAAAALASGSVSVISRDPSRDIPCVPRVGMYRPEPTYIYGFPSQAAALQSAAAAGMVQNGTGLPTMKMITSGITTYYDARREPTSMENGVVVSGSNGGGERSRERELAVVTDEASVVHQMNGVADEETEKELTVDVVDNKDEERILGDQEVDEDDASKRLVIGNKAKIIVRKRSDPTRFLPNHKRKRIR